MRATAISLLNGLGVAAWSRRRFGQQVAVLMYHGVLPDDDLLADGDWLQVRVSEFRAQMAELARHYEPVRVADLLRPLPPARRPRVAVTFDDGYANNLHHALPVLREFSIPATVFVATAQIGSDRLFWWDRLHLARPGRPVPQAITAALKRLPQARIDTELAAYLAAEGRLAPPAAPDSYRSLSVDELQALSTSGLVDIGSHTHGHEILDRLSDDEVRATLADSVAALARWNISTALFAAPNGDYLDRQIPLIEANGFAMCVSTQPGLWQPSDNPYRVPRLGIGRGTSAAEFALTVAGAMLRLRRGRGALADSAY